MTLVGTVRWTFLALAVAATAVTLLLLLWSMRGRRSSPELPRSDRRRQTTAHGDPREALALVGDALAATHNPRALVPLILEVLTEATGGLADLIAPHARTIDRVDPLLTLDGLRLVWERNR